MAENYPSDEILKPGDVVAFDPTGNKKIKKASISDIALAGIVSTTPGITLGEGIGTNLTGQDLFIGQKKDNEVPLALAGRVPVKISDENGSIKAGDRLTVSKTLPGYAMKQTQAGQSIGIALENGGSDRVLVFVNLSYWMPTVNDLSFLTSFSSSSFNSASSSSLPTPSLNSLFASILNQFKKIGVVFENGIVRAKEFIADKVTAKQIKTEELCVDDVCVTRGQFKKVFGENNSSLIINEESAEEQSSIPTPTPLPSESPISTPEPELTPESTPEITLTPEPSPEPSESPTPSPIPEPTPNSTLEPTPATEPPESTPQS